MSTAADSGFLRRVAFAACACVLSSTCVAETVLLEEIGIEGLPQRRGTPRIGRTIRDQPIRLGGVEYPHGIGTRSISEFVIDLKGNARRFVSMVGIDDEIRGDVGSVTFE